MDNSKKIKELQDKIKELEDEQQLFDSKGPKYKLAELIHAKICRWNHTDGCSWGYESWENIGIARQRYLEKAESILVVVDYNIAALVINNL